MSPRLPLPTALRLCALGAIAAGTACSVITSFDNLTGAESGADAAPDATDDKAVDAPGADATPADAGPEAAKPFCLGLSPAPVFCDDFDEDALMKGWSALELTPDDGGTVILDPTSFVSPPFSLVATANANSNIDVGESFDLYRDFVQAATSEVHLSFDLRIDAFDPMAKANIISVEFGPPPYYSRFGLTLALVNGGAVLEQITPRDDAGSQHYIDTNFATTPLPGKWAHVQQNVTFGPTPMTTVFVDGMLVLSQALDSSRHGGPVTLFVGVTYTLTPVKKMAFRYDNVVLDFK